MVVDPGPALVVTTATGQECGGQAPGCRQLTDELLLPVEKQRVRACDRTNSQQSRRGGHSDFLFEAAQPVTHDAVDSPDVVEVALFNQREHVIYAGEGSVQARVQIGMLLPDAVLTAHF